MLISDLPLAVVQPGLYELRGPVPFPSALGEERGLLVFLYRFIAAREHGASLRDVCESLCVRVWSPLAFA